MKTHKTAKGMLMMALKKDTKTHKTAKGELLMALKKGHENSQDSQGQVVDSTKEEDEESWPQETNGGHQSSHRQHRPLVGNQRVRKVTSHC